MICDTCKHLFDKDCEKKCERIKEKMTYCPKYEYKCWTVGNYKKK